MSSELQNKIVTDSAARTEQALRASELSYRRLFEAAQDGILILDVDTGRITDVNPFLIKVLGFSHDEMVGKTVGELSPFKDIVSNQAMLERLQKDGYLRYHDLPLETRDGRKIAVEFVSNVYQAGDKKVIQCNIRDITQRKNGEEAMRQSERRFQTLADTSPVGIFRTNAQGQTTYVNPQWCQIAGLSAKDALGHGWLRAVHPEDREKLTQGWQAATQVQGASKDDYRLVHPDGTISWVMGHAVPEKDDAGRIVGYVGTITDITERKRAEEKLHLRESVLSAITENQPGLLWLKDAEGRFLMVNKAFAIACGRGDPEKVHGLTDLDIWPKELAEKYRHDDQRVMTTGNACMVEEMIIIGNSRPWHETFKTPVRDDKGRVIGTTGYARDITERKQAEEELKLFRALIENSSDAIHVVDSATGRFLDVNESACRALGCTRAEHLALTVFDVVVGVDRALFDATLARAKETGHATAEVQHRRKDGTTYSVEVSLSPITLDREYLVAIVRDVTERKRAEQLLQFNAQEGWTGRHEDYFARLVELIGQTAGVDYAFIGRIKDAQTVQTTGLYAKGKIAPDIEYSTRGAPCHNVIGKTLCHYGEKLQELFPDDALLAEMGAQSYLGIPLMDSSGKPLGLMAVLDTKPMPDARSATALLQIAAVRVAGELERIAAEEALRESEKRYHGLFEHMVEGFAYCRMIFENGEPKDWIYLSVNSVFEKLTGLKGVAGKRVSEVIPGVAKTDPELFKCFARVSLTGEPERFEIFVQALQQWFDISVYSPEKEFFVAVFDVITQRKLAEAALRASEQEFRTLAEAMPQIVWATRPDGWNIYFNQHWVDYTGLTLEESYGHGWNKPFHPDDRQRAWDAWQDATQNDATYSLECRLRRADGAYRWWLIRGEPLRDTDGKILKWFGTCTDIEDIKQAESALRDSEAFLNTVIEKIPHMIFVKDAKELRFVKFNQAGQDLLGYSLAELAGKSDFDLFPKEQADFYTEQDRNVLRGREVVDIPEEPVQTRDKGERIVHTKKIPILDNAGQLTYLLGISEDITDRKRAEQFQARLATAVEQAAETIVITDTKSTILYANPAFEKTSGYTCAEALGQTPRILKSGKQDAEFYRRMWEVLGRGEIWSGHFINRRKDGVFYEEEATISPVRDVAGTIVNYVAVKRDVTREMQLEAQFHQSQKMEAVGQLAGGVAHDFNNILGVIMGYGDLITSDLDPDDPLRKYAEEIRNAAERAAGLTRQLLVFSRKQKVQPVVLDLNGTVKDLDKMLRRLIGENIEMMIVPGNEVGRIKADAGYVGQVLMNLAINARDAMPNGGKLTIATNNVTLDENYTRTHMGVIPGDYVMMSVSDTGTGMTEEVKARMFEPLFTTKPAGKGTGLGLATCQTIVQQSGGHIGVYSEVGKGTTFKIYFPRVDKPVEGASGPSQDGPLPRGTETLLVVEDEPSVRHLAWKVLEALGYHVLRATNGQDGLHLAREHKGSPIRLVVTDVMMPKMDGKVMAEWLKATYPDLKVLFTSGYTDDVIAQHGVLEPGVAFLSKPYTPATLARKVRAMLDNETDTSIVRKRCLTIEQSPPGFA